MYSLHGVQQVYVYADKRIVKSSAVGETTVEEIQWLSEKLLEYAAGWKEEGFGYLVGIEEMTPVKADVSKELITLHKRLEDAGCKAIAFVDPNAYVIATQAKSHQRKSKVSYKEKHFRTEEEAIAWLEERLK
ncbi:MAG: hypothetical protein E7264_08010 [Lachnospiraceae bacterium]|nr:hypothetical protein [Lachnospiraceae bacterium]